MAEDKVKVQASPVKRDPDAEALVPAVDIHEADDGTTVLEAELPGAGRDAVDIRVDKGVLTIEADAEVPVPEGDYSRTYTGFVGGRYFRAFALSDGVDRERIDASFADGVLTLRLPKAAAAKTKRIEIKGE